MRLLLISLLLLAEIPTAEVHDFHVSRARIEYAADQQEWQISLHIFIDDLEEALEEKGAQELYLGTAKESAQADVYLERYLRTYFLLLDDEDELSWEWIGKETSEDLTAFWIYLYVPNAAKMDRLTVQNKILLDRYDDQQNMVQVKGAGGQLKNYLFHQDYWQEEVVLD